MILLVSDRFVFRDGVIYDEWTDYIYEYDEYGDWEDVCGLLNQIHNILERSMGWK